MRAALTVLSFLALACSQTVTVLGGPEAEGSAGVGGAGPVSVSSGAGAGAVTSSGADVGGSSVVTVGPGGGPSSSASGAGGEPPDPECGSAADCPEPENECQAATCDGGVCGTKPKPAITLPDQVDGDCKTAKCDGMGNVVQAYAPSDLESDGSECTVDACTMSGPTYTPKADGTWCTETCGCPQHNGGVCGESNVSCTRGLCDAGACVDAIPVVCKVGVKTYTRCDLTAGDWRISWDGEEPWDSCAAIANDVGYCAPGSTCYVYEGSTGPWLGPVNGTGVCQ